MAGFCRMNGRKTQKWPTGSGQGSEAQEEVWWCPGVMQRAWCEVLWPDLCRLGRTQVGIPSPSLSSAVELKGGELKTLPWGVWCFRGAFLLPSLYGRLFPSPWLGRIMLFAHFEAESRVAKGDLFLGQKCLQLVVFYSSHLNTNPSVAFV